MLYGETTDPQKAAVEATTKDFETKYPNVKVDIQYQALDALLKVIKLQMGSDNPPDLANGNQGYDVMGTLVKAGLILNLDKYATQHGWDTKFTPGTIAPNRLTPDGKTFGSGSLYGVSQASEYVAVFYNKANLAKLGITDASTLDTKSAFEAALAKAKQMGMTPDILGDATKFPGTHNYTMFQGAYVPAATSNAWVYGTSGSTVNDAAHIQAAQDYQTWATNGWFNSDALAVSAPDAAARFAAGEGVFFVDGDFRGGILTAAGMGDNLGWMLYPPGDSGKHAAVGSISLPIMISAKSKQPDCAAEYLDWITTSDSAKLAMLANGRIPATGVPADMLAKARDPLLQQEISEYDRLLKDDGLMAWEDWATPDMLDLMGANTQSLIAGKMTPTDYVKAMQADWDKFQASR